MIWHKDRAEVLSYNCQDIPNLDIEVTGSYPDGCIPRYEVQQTSLVLIFDTDSCKESDVDNAGLIVGIICAIVAICIIVVVIAVVLSSNDSLNVTILLTRQKKVKRTSVSMNEISSKMKQVDNEINEVNDKVVELNEILDHGRM